MASLTVMVPWLVWQGSSLPGIPSARDPRPHLALEAITHLEIVILNFLEKAGLQCHFFLNAKLQWPKNEAAVSCFTATFHSWFWPCCCYFAAWMLASPMTWILSKWRCMGARHWHTDAWILNSESILSLLGALDLHGFTGVLKLRALGLWQLWCEVKKVHYTMLPDNELGRGFWSASASFSMLTQVYASISHTKCSKFVTEHKDENQAIHPSSSLPL